MQLFRFPPSSQPPDLATTDFNLWPAASRTVLVLLMFIGACAGSTGGGIKVSRCVVMVKSVVKDMGSYLHPNSVKKIKLDGKPVDHEVLRSINVFFITYMIIFAASVFLVSLEGRDMVTNFTAVAATFNNIGPRPGRGRPNTEFRCAFHSLQIHPDV